MANRIGTAMDAVKSPALESTRDRPASKPKRHQLPPRHHTVLPLGKCSDCRVRVASVRFFIYGMQNRTLAVHAPDAAVDRRARGTLIGTKRARNRGSSPPVPPLALIP
jgi:hypothetical protein